MKQKDNPFVLLGASPRDSRKRLQELRDNAQLTAQHAADGAYAALIHPQERLTAELRWTDEQDDRPVAPLNRELENLQCRPQAQNAAGWTMQICACFGAVGEAQLLEAINADREKAGWRAVQTEEWQSALEAFRKEIASLLDELWREKKTKNPLAAYADTLLELIRCYAEGKEHFAGNALIEELVSCYELRVSAVADQLREQVMQVVSQREETQRKSWSPETVKKVCSDVREWDALTQPVRKLRLARGMHNRESAAFADEIRLFMAEVFNNLYWYPETNRLIETLHICFPECDALQKQLEKDRLVVSQQMKSLKTMDREQRWENYMRMLRALGGVILCVFAVLVLDTFDNDADRSSKRPPHTLPAPTAPKYNDPAVRRVMEYLLNQNQEQEQNLTPLEKKQKEIDAKQEELRKATASGANHAKLLQLTFELKSLQEEYEALELAEEENDQ